MILENLCHELSVFLMIVDGTFFKLPSHLYSALTKQTRTQTADRKLCPVRALLHYRKVQVSCVSYLKLQCSLCSRTHNFPMPYRILDILLQLPKLYGMP